MCSTHSSKEKRPIWLILPVVICFFQGLSHANVSGLGVTRGDCVRLIKRLIVYPTKGACVLSNGITALTGQLIPGRKFLCRKDQSRGKTRGWGEGSYWPEQRPTRESARQKGTPRGDAIVDTGQRSRSDTGKLVAMRCWTNSPPIR